MMLQQKRFLRADPGKNVMKKLNLFCAATFVASAAVAAVGPNLVRNPSFELVPGPQEGQGLLPTFWEQVEPAAVLNADTWSTDGLYGLHPDNPMISPHYSGMSADDGVRWVAAWSAIPEVFGQQLTAPLIPGRPYRIEASLLQSQRSDVSFPGGYDVLLAESPSYLTAVGVVSLPPTISADDWEEKLGLFVAPIDADQRPWLVFRPYAEFGSAYPGMDSVALHELERDGDIDLDGDVDIDDFQLFINCLAGPEITTPPASCDPISFALADLVGDADVDLADADIFMTILGQ